MQKIIKTGKPNNSAEPANEFKATAVLPYVKGLSEQLRRCLQQQGVRAVFKSEITLKSQLVRPKDAVDQDRNAPIRAVENNKSQQSIMLCKITHDQSTSSPEED